MLIDREALLEKFQDRELFNVTEKHLSLIREAPLINAAEVRHGTWVEAKQGEMLLYPDGQKMCSECKTIMPSQWVNMPPYCFGCGAKMDGRRESEGT